MSWMVILAVPMGVLFSSLMTFGSMSMAHEVTIIKASGGSLIRMMTPVIIGGFFLYLGLFYFNDVILPESNHQVKIMMNDIRRKKPTFALESGLFSTQLDGYTILARHVDSIDGTLSGVTIYDMTKFQNRNIISSDSGRISFTPDYKKLILDLKEGEIHQFSVNAVNDYKIIRFSDYRIAMNAYGFAFEQSSSDMVSKGDREMNVGDMKAIVNTADSNRNNILIRVDSIVKKTIDDMIFGKPILAVDTSYISQSEQERMLIASKQTDIAKIQKKTIIPAKKIEKPIVKPKEVEPVKVANVKQDTTKTYRQIVQEKFAAAVNKGNTDINPDTIYSAETQKELQSKLAIEKKRLVEDSIKVAGIAKSLEKPVEKINIVPTAKVKEKVSGTISGIQSSTETAKPYNQALDTAYNEVLNRVMQQANLAKSAIQADINNVRFFDARSKQYRVEIYKKYSLPFACVIFILVGAPLGIITKGGNFGISAGISLVFYVFYWACLIGGEKLGDRGIIEPWLGMWMANILVGSIGILLTLRVNNESLKFKLPFLKKKA
jgi:lipopolysaccharide export system permease protein